MSPAPLQAEVMQLGAAAGTQAAAAKEGVGKEGVPATLAVAARRAEHVACQAARADTAGVQDRPAALEAALLVAARPATAMQGGCCETESGARRRRNSGRGSRGLRGRRQGRWNIGWRQRASVRKRCRGRAVGL